MFRVLFRLEKWLTTYPAIAKCPNPNSVQLMHSMDTVIKVLMVTAVAHLSVHVHCTRMHSNAARQSDSASQMNCSNVVRHKRYLDFLPKSRMFFRANIKANLLSINQVIAFAYGFRANYPIENDRKIRRRDVYESVEEMMSNQGFEGSACIAKIFCAATRSIAPETESGIFSKLFKLVFTLQRDSSYPFLTTDGCSNLATMCPVQMLHLSPYTDV